MKLAHYLLAGLLVTSIAQSQDLVLKAAPSLEPVVLTNCTIYTVSDGIVLNGTLWFHNGVIKGVLTQGTAPKLPDGCKPRVIDLQGKHVYPGLISAHTSLGLEEIGMVPQSVDVDEFGDFTPEVVAAVAVNPDTTAIPVARSNGVLAAGVFPRGGLIAGRASVIQLDGWTNADLTVRANAGVVISWPARRFGDRPRRRGFRDRGASSPEVTAETRRQTIARAFTDARAWLEAHTADSNLPIDIRHLALAPALNGEVPLFMLANELEQIESAVLWATDAGMRPVIVGGRDAVECAALLRQRDVPVIIDGVHKMPRRDDSPYDEAFTRPARLAKAGVRFCIGTGSDYSNDRNLPYEAAAAAAHGLEPRRALAAITLDAAKILGVGDRLGSLTKGKDATLFISNGSPLELVTVIDLAFVQGRQIDLRNKQTELARKYRERYRQLKAK